MSAVYTFSQFLDFVITNDLEPPVTNSKNAILVKIPFNSF